MRAALRNRNAWKKEAQYQGNADGSHSQFLKIVATPGETPGQLIIPSDKVTLFLPTRSRLCDIRARKFLLIFQLRQTPSKA
jgi:hypothetical protein